MYYNDMCDEVKTFRFQVFANEFEPLHEFFHVVSIVTFVTPVFFNRRFYSE